MRYPARVGGGPAAAVLAGGAVAPWPLFVVTEDLLVQPSSTPDLGNEVIPAAPDGAQGRRSLKVRAVDGRGALQTARQAPPHPSGASGYDQVDVVSS